MSLGMSWLLLDLANQADAADNRRRRAEMRTLTNKPFQMTEKDFQKTYRLSKSLVNSLVQELSTVIPQEKRSDALSVQNKVLIALAFFATGSYQNLVGQNIYHYVSQPTVSKAIKEVTKALNIPHIFKKYVYFPETQQKRDNIKKRFYDKFKIPGVIGCIDGTHVAIIRPTLYEERYFNRKGYHSLNVMIICDANLNILCIDPSSPGSTHDSIVWRDHPLNCYINEKYNNGEIMFFLGDSGYPLRKTMMTPFLNAIDGTSESHYYKLQVSARNTVERCIGVLKARFRLDPPIPQSQFQMENNKAMPATQQPTTQQHLMAHHVHPNQVFTQQHPIVPNHLTLPQQVQIQPNGVMHQLIQSQYQSNLDARSPLLENRHDLCSTSHRQDYAKHYGANDNYNYPQSPPIVDRTDLHTDQNVNHEMLQNIPKGYNAEVYQDYLKRNPPKDANQIYQNHQPMYRPNMNQYGSKPYLPFSNRIGPQSNTEMLRRQYNEIQQMKLQQQIQYQNQAQMHQQQKFAERQLLLQQIHGVQPPPNLQNSIYSDGSYRDLDRYSSKTDFKDYSSPDIQKDVDRYVKNNEYKEIDKQKRQYEESQWQTNQYPEFREPERQRYQDESQREMKSNNQFQSPDANNHSQKSNVGVISPMKSSESSSPSVRSPSSDSRRSSSGNQALRSPIAQRIPSAPVTMSGILYKQGSDGLKVWRKRWFVLSEYCLFYYKSQDEEKLLGSVLLPSYKVSACTAEDKVLRKFALKLEHANMRTYILAAPDQESMLKWVKALTMAALMQDLNEPPQKQNERLAAKPEDGDETPGPTYANAPPKPRRSNDGYNSPSSDVYDPNYDLLKKPASQYSQGTTYTRYQEHNNYPNSPNQESIYNRSIPSPSIQQQHQYQTKRQFDMNQLSLPLTNLANDRVENNRPTTSSARRSNPQSPYFDNRSRQQQIQNAPDGNKEPIYDQQPQRNPFLQNNMSPPEALNDMPLTNRPSKTKKEHDRSKLDEIYSESTTYTKSNADPSAYGQNVSGPLPSKFNRTPVNERLHIERQTHDTYGRSTNMPAYGQGKNGEYEDVYGNYATRNVYSHTNAKSPNPSQSRDSTSISSHQQQQIYSGQHPQEKTFSGPSVLRRKKMQSSGIQPPMPRPHSADFLEYESKNEMLSTKETVKPTGAPLKQPPRPKSSLDIHSYYDPNSDRYYSEESYAEKMRQSAQYLQQGLISKNIQIPLAKYASGLAEKQLQSHYSQSVNNNYDSEFAGSKLNRDNISYNSKYSDLEGINSNWTLKEKEMENQRDCLNRSGSVMSDGSNVAVTKDVNKFDPNSEGFIRSASARLPSTFNEKDGDKKIQQREESMKRLLEWKQRMLQSPLTRKSTPATISLARSLNHSRQSLRADPYKSKTYTNASYNSYSSDDEEDTSATDLQIPRNFQAGRSQKESITNPIISPPLAPHVLSTTLSNCGEDSSLNSTEIVQTIERTYENISFPETETVINEQQNEKDPDTTDSMPTGNQNKDEENEGYETHESEAESETQIEYTDNDMDEVLLLSDTEPNNSKDNPSNAIIEKENKIIDEDAKSETPIQVTGEDHYLPMSPRQISIEESTHISILENLNILDQLLPFPYEDNPYVEMNLGNEEDDTQTYEVVCVNNGKMEPVYMELSNVINKNESITPPEDTIKTLSDTASNFADTKTHTLKRSSKGKKNQKDQTLETLNKSVGSINIKSDCSDADDESSREISLETPYSRFSISDTFRPASYYLSGVKHTLDRQDSSDSEFCSPSIPDLISPPEELTDEALSKYVLDKLDKSDISQDSSILKMLTSENQKMTTMKRKTTSLMIYGSKTSIHDTLSRGEKIKNNRASLSNDRNKVTETQIDIQKESILEHYSSSIESDSLRSYSADKESSRLSSISDASNKFGTSRNDVGTFEIEPIIELRFPHLYKDAEMIAKRRPLSDDSLFSLVAEENSLTTENVDLDRYLDNLQPTLSNTQVENSHANSSFIDACNDAQKDRNINMSFNDTRKICHHRSLSNPDSNINESDTNKNTGENSLLEPISVQSSPSTVNLSTSPISYYCKNYDEEKYHVKNLKTEILCDKIKEYENDKLTLNPGTDTNASSSTTGFHSRESSTEHSAPYYYSDLSSQEHINLLSTPHYLKNTNLHRKLNNQRRRGPLHKKNEISHIIHNPIHNNQVFDRPNELVASARSISVEFLTAADKDPEIDLKNIYESSGGKNSKIPKSMTLIAGLSSKRNPGNTIAQPETTSINNNGLLNHSSQVMVSTASMSSHCSENSSNTVYYDAETETSTYENVNCPGENHWDEDSLWRDNLRRVSNRHARSMDDLDTMPVATAISKKSSMNVCGTNSIKRVKKEVGKKITRNVTYVNCLVQNQTLKPIEDNNSFQSVCSDENESVGSNDVYVSLAEAKPPQQLDEGVYEQLAMDSSDNSVSKQKITGNDKLSTRERNKKKFEIDREKLRQWDLMSSGLLKGSGVGRVRSAGIGMGLGDAFCSTDSGADSASNEASMTMAATNTNPEINNIHQTMLSKKTFLGSNTSIGRTNRDVNIPVRAVSPRVRWVEDKASNDHYGLRQLSASQQNLQMLNTTEDSWSTARSPSRASQQPIRAVSPRVRRNTEGEEMRRQEKHRSDQVEHLGEVPTAGELLGRTHEELVLLLIQLRRRHTATHRAIEQCCVQISSIEDCLNSLKAMEREENLQRLEQLKLQLIELEHQYEKSKPLVQLVDNMVKLGSLYNRPGSTIERLERNQRLRQKVLAEHAFEQQRWLESAAAGKPLETEAARARVAELWSLEQELADEAAILQGLKTDKDTIESLLTGVRGKLDSIPRSELGGSMGGINTMSASNGMSAVNNGNLEAELARVHAMLAHNSKKLEQTVADNARLERELQHLRRALQAQRAAAPAHAMQAAAPTHTTHATAMLEDEVSRVQQLVSDLQRQRQELSRAVRHLTHQSQALQTTHNSLPGNRRPLSAWSETNLDTGHTTDHGQSDYDYEMVGSLKPPGHYPLSNMNTPLYVDTRVPGTDIISPLTSEDLHTSGFGNLSNVEKQEIKTVRIVKRESERRQRDRERSLQPMADLPSNSITANLDQFLEEELMQSSNYPRALSVPRNDFSKFEEYSSRAQVAEPPSYLRLNDKMSSMELSPKYPSSPSLSNYDYSRDISSLSSSYHRSYDRSSYDRTISLSNQYLNSPTDSSRTLTNGPLSKTSSIGSLTRSHMELSPIFKSEAAKQIITEMSGDVPKNGSLHRRQVPKEKRRHYTAPHHLSAKTLNEIPKDGYNQDKLGRSLDDADMERALRAPPDVVRSAIAPQRFADTTIDQLLAAPQKILIPERYIPEKPPELSPEEQQKRQEKVESIKKMLSSSSTDANKSPDKEEKRQREHLLQMNQILAKQVTEMSKIIAVKALEELPQQNNSDDLDDLSPDVELPIYQQRDNFFT